MGSHGDDPSSGLVVENVPHLLFKMLPLSCIHTKKMECGSTQSENGRPSEPGFAQIEPVILPDVSVVPLELSVTSLPITQPSELLAASPIPAPNVETMAKETQKSIEISQADPADRAVIPSLFQPTPRSEFPRDGLPGAAVGPLTQEPSWSDGKPVAPNVHLPSTAIEEQSPVKNLASSVGQLRQSIDYHFAMDTADQKTGTYSTSAPPNTPPFQDAGRSLGFQNSLDAGPVDPNIAPIMATMPASNTKSSPDAALTQSEASILPDINAQPKLDDRVRVVQSDNNTIRLLAEAETLGKMAISVSLFENGTEVAFKTESAETARQLNNAGSQLANRLDEVGGRQSRVTVEMTDHEGLSNGFAQDGSRQPRSSESWTGPKTSQSAAVGTEIGAEASSAPQKAGRLA